MQYRALPRTQVGNAFELIFGMIGRAYIATPVRTCDPVIVENVEKRCPCGRRLLTGQNPECQIQVVTIYYCVHGDTAGKPASRVSQAWFCLHEGNEELSAAQIRAWFFSPEKDADSLPERLPERIKEATSDYVTDLLDENIVGDKLTTALWEASNGCPFIRIDPIMQTVNKNVKTGLSNGLNLAFRDAGLPALPAEAISGITADFILAPASKAIRTASITFELIGVAVGTLTMNPALVTACVHSLMGKAVMQAVTTAINQGLTGETTMSAVSDQEAVKTEVTEPKTEAADRLTTRLGESSTHTLSVDDATWERLQRWRDSLGQSSDTPREILKRTRATDASRNPATGTTEITAL